MFNKLNIFKTIYKMETQQINNVVVKPIPIPKIPLENIRGSDMFPEIYANIYLSAKKKSGKTSVIYNIIKNCADKNTTVITFCATCKKDKNWIEIRNYLDKKKIPNEFYMGIKDNGNVLQELILDMQTADNSDDEPSESEEEPEIVQFSGKKYKKHKKKKPKIKSPKYIIIFDDISSELKDPNISHLLKTNRHYKAKVILSSQYVNDLVPMARRQIDFYLLFGGINEQKLKEIYMNADLNISEDDYIKLYHDATNEKYNFFYIDTNGEYRRNFNQKYLI